MLPTLVMCSIVPTKMSRRVVTKKKTMADRLTWQDTRRVCVCVCACVRACVRACVCVCV